MPYRGSWTGALTSADIVTFLQNQTVIVCDSSTRPAAPTVGMVIYETDNVGYSYWNGSAWKILFWPARDFATTIFQGSVIAATVTTSRVTRLGDTVHYEGVVAITGGGGGSSVNISLPYPIRNRTMLRPIGWGWVIDASASNAEWMGSAFSGLTGYMSIRTMNSGTNGQFGTLGPTGGFQAALAAGDTVGWNVTYETG
jgi:hypothetical protein